MELQELALKLSTTCAEESCRSLLKCSKPKNEKEYRSLAANILKHHEEDHRHVNEAGRPRGDSNASSRTSITNTTQGSTSPSASNASLEESCAKTSTEKSWADIVGSRPLGEINTNVSGRRRLTDTACMEAKDVDVMSPSELALHRRRLTHGVRTPP